MLSCYSKAHIFIILCITFQVLRPFEIFAFETRSCRKPWSGPIFLPREAKVLAATDEYVIFLLPDCYSARSFGPPEISRCVCHRHARTYRPAGSALVRPAPQRKSPAGCSPAAARAAAVPESRSLASVASSNPLSFFDRDTVLERLHGRITTLSETVPQRVETLPFFQILGNHHLYLLYLLFKYFDPLKSKLMNSQSRISSRKSSLCKPLC